jgi:pyridoxine 5-phosphate synthase
MVKLSVNVNKVATVRNSRGGSVPSVVHAARVAVAAGAHGITVHPRADARHITFEDVTALAGMLAPFRDRVEFNIEGDPRPDLIDLVHRIGPHQCTLVPVQPGEVTSQAGWSVDTPRDEFRATVAGLKSRGVRVSLFVDPEPSAVEWAADMGGDRVELYTEPYARAFTRGADAASESMRAYGAAAVRAHELGLGVNAGHDLDLDNLLLFRTLPYLDEVSIGHAIVSRAIFVGLDRVVREYLAVLKDEHP